MSDADKIAKLIEIGSSPEGIKGVQALAAETMKQIGYVYPRKSCAATLSHFLRTADIDVPVTTGAQRLADRLRSNRHWNKVKLGDQQAGDVAVCKSLADDVPGADHIFLVIERKDSDLMVIADNQCQGKTHLRRASGSSTGEGSKTPTDYFLRAPQVRNYLMSTDLNLGLDEVGDENTNDLPELFMDDGSTRLTDE